MKPMRHLCHDDRGATAIEYGLILALIALTAMTALSALADQNEAIWTKVKQRSQEAIEKAS